LGKLNVAICAAVIVVYLLRRPLRTFFGAPIAYAVWLLVPITDLAVLLPPRVVAAPPAHLAPVQQFAPIVIRQIPHALVHFTEQLARQGLPLHPLIAARPTEPAFAMADYAILLFAAWVLGAILMALYLAQSQARFHAAIRLGEAGPAVVGFLRPRIVVPDTFQEQFTIQEQAAILAHEHVHLARQDARTNALAALLRCLCWFNPLAHLGTFWLRVDQELACDATTVAGPVSRRHYANALVKSQMMAAVLPLGCNWRGSQHPLIERIALLKCKPPSTARRITGAGIVMLATASVGLTAWAAQPPEVAKFVAGPKHDSQIALHKAPIMVVAQGGQGVVDSVSAPSPNLASPPPHISRQANLVIQPLDL
jgi:beta-lactamase regulating signal transducer with metallopeptidase domain